MLRSAKRWNELGLWIKKGEKATWVDGKPVFSEEQVKLAPQWYGNTPDWAREEDQFYEHQHHYGWGND